MTSLETAVPNVFSPRNLIFRPDLQTKIVHSHVVTCGLNELWQFTHSLSNDFFKLSDSRRGRCQLLMKEWPLNIDKLPPGQKWWFSR